MKQITDYDELNVCPDTGEKNPDCEDCLETHCERGKYLISYREELAEYYHYQDLDSRNDEVD